MQTLTRMKLCCWKRVTTMVMNLLFDYGGDKDPDEWDYQAMEQAINAEIQSLIAACQRCPAKVVLVTNEWDGDRAGESSGTTFWRYCRAGKSAAGRCGK